MKPVSETAIAEVVQPVGETAVDMEPEGSLSDVIEGETDEIHNLSLNVVIEVTVGKVEADESVIMDTGIVSNEEQLAALVLAEEVLPWAEELEESGLTEATLETESVMEKGKGKVHGAGTKKGVKLVLILKGASTRKRNVHALASPRMWKDTKAGSRGGDEINPPDPVMEKGLPGVSKPPNLTV